MIAQLFPARVHTVTVTGDMAPAPLLPEEERCIRRAVEQRRREFAAGRACARKALEHFGIYNHPLVVGPDRAPVWPEDIAGSITHCQGFVGAAVARRGVIRGIGVDAERAHPLDPDLIELICSPREREWIRAVAPPDYSDWAKVLFSAKEAVYKCLASRCERPLGFHDVEITVQPAVGGGQLAVHFPGQPPFQHPERIRLDGRFATSPAHVFTAVLLTT